MKNCSPKLKNTAFFFGLLFFLFPNKAFAGDVAINELMVHPLSGSDWIELYNASATDVSIENWKLIDATSTVVTLSGSISGKEFKVLEVSNRLNNGGDAITLKNQADLAVDTYSYTSDPGIDRSVGREMDGIGNWVVFNSPTKESSNNASQPLPTSTPTPQPTSTPTPTTKPTPTQKPTSTPKPSSSKETSAPVVGSSNLSKPTSLSFTSSAKSPIAKGSRETILGERTAVATSTPTKTPTPTKKPEVKTLGSSQNNLPKVLIGLGIIFLIACGILAFYSYKKKESKEPL